MPSASSILTPIAAGALPLPTRLRKRGVQAVGCRLLIASLTPEQLTETFGSRFVDYLLVENGDTTLNNTAWYIERLTERVEIRGDVLEVGAGFGMAALVIAECADGIRSYRGIDPDEGKIATFRKLIDRLDEPRVTAEVGAGEALPFGGDSFDLVLCNECISHVRSIRDVLAEIRRVLRPGGRVIISDTACWNPYALWFKYARGHLDENYQSKPRMRRFLRAAGFRDITRAGGLVAPRNPWRDRADRLWWLNRWIDPKYVLVGVAR